MSLTISLIVLAFGIALLTTSWRIAARPADPIKPRFISWNVVMIIAVFVIFIMLVNIANLAGFKTGRL